MLKPEYAPVCYEELRPAEVKALREKTPVAYIVTGTLEWHGRQNPLGTDSLIAHSMCCTAALKYGGVVLPPFYQGLLGDNNWGPAGWENYTVGFNQPPTMELAMKAVATALLAAGWKVLAGVSGHGVPEQVGAMRRGFEAAIGQRKDVASLVLIEGEWHKADADLPLQVDHAAAWETSCMMYLTGDRVDLHALDGSPWTNQEDWTWGPEGVAGKNPLRHASVDMGEKIVRRMADEIGQKAMALLRQVQPQ